MVIRPEEPQSCGTGGYDPWSEPYFGVAFAPPQEDPMFKDLLNPIDVLLQIAYPPEEDPPEPEVNPLDIYCGASFNGAQSGCSSTVVNEYIPPGRRDTSASLSYQGVNWFQNSRPELRTWTDPDGTERLYIVLSARRYLEFVRLKDGSTLQNTWVGTNGTVGAVRWTPDTSSLPGIYEWHDARGYVWTFFDHDDDAHDAAGHLWKVASADGSGTHSAVLYTGHETNISTALSAGFVQSGGNPTNKPALVYDRSDRKISYTYSGNQLVTIKWETLDTTPVLSRQVDFTYYSSSSNTNDANHGSDGDLKFIKTTVPQSSGGNIEYVKYFRYYVGSYNESTNPGHVHKMKLSMSAEAVRRYDLVDSSLGDYMADLDAEDDADLRSYSSRYFEYEADDPQNGLEQRPTKMYINGLCGCGSSSGGWYEFSYEDNAAFDSTINTNGYTRQDDWGYQYWASRAMMTRPDGSTITAYFDEVGQMLGVVRCSGSPTSPGVTFWITKYERDERGRVTRLFTPEAVDTAAYRHTTSGSDKAGTIQTNASDGLVYTWTYYDPGSGNQNYLPTAVTKREHSKGRTGTKYTDWTVEYASPSNSTYWRYKDVRYGTEAVYARLAMPLPTKIRAYKNEVTGAGSASDYDEISFAYTFHQVSSSDTWLVQKKTITYTAVPLANNGSDSAVSRAKYYRRDGRLAFDESASGVFTYYDYAVSGQIKRKIVDAKTNSSDSALTSDASAVGATLPSSGSALTTVYTYDGQDRLVGVTDPSTRESVYHYTKLADGRRVRLTVPRKDGSTFYGPASYAVLNQAGKTEAQGVIAFSGTTSGFAGTTTTAIASWIDEADSDPIDAVAHGSLSRLSVNIYNETGGRATTARTYFKVPTSLPGSPASTYYDETQYTYDNVGRVARVIDPSGTRTRWVYDQRDRVTQRWIGTTEPTTGTFDPNPSTLNVGDYALTDVYEYDGGSTGNNHLTKKQQDVDGDSTTSTDRRTTSYTYDYRGRLVIQENPLAPHALFKYDNRDRVVGSATLSSLSGVTVSSDPAASSFSNRLSLSLTSYDERGQVYRTVRRKIDQSTGGFSSGDDLTSNNWFDKDMRLIKTQGASLTKYTYDRLGRRTHTFVLAKIDDSEADSTLTTADYTAAGTVENDVVLEEHQTIYEDATSNVLFTASLSRHHDASTTATGPLDYAGGSGGLLTLTANDLRVGGSSSAAVLARAQITATWYDALDRPIHTAQYGTFGLNESGGPSSFSHPGTGPSNYPTRSNSVLVTSTTYDTDGTVLEVEAPGKPSSPSGTAGTKTRYLYDKAARQVAVISNYTGGSLSNDDRATDTYVRYAYTTGLMTAMWVDIQGDDTDGVPPSALSGADAKDQITKYVYGTTRGSTPGSGTPPQSQVATGHLLREAIYPPQTGSQAESDRTVSYAYNALAEQVWTKDQNGTILKTTLDAAGRETSRVADTLGTDIDGSVRRIDLSYTARGQVLAVDQYAATSGTSSPVNGVKYTYDDWGNVTNIAQDRNGVVASSGGDEYSVAFDYARTAPTNGRYAYRRTKMSLPWHTTGTFDVNYTYSSSSSLDDVTSRVTSMTFTTPGPSTTGDRVRYQYLGRAQLVGTEYPEPVSNHNFYTISSSVAVYDRLDTFNRVVTDLWTGGQGQAGNATYDVGVEYDRNGNPTGQLDRFVKSGGSLIYSSKYTMDDLNRVTKADRGIYTGGTGSVSGSTRYVEDWTTLTQTGNWSRSKLDLDANSVYTGSGEFDETRDHNAINQILTRDTDSNSSVNYSLAYNKGGQMTDDGKTYKMVYDAFGRLVQVKDRTGSNYVIAEYRYDGLGQRVAQHSRADGVFNRSVNSDDPWEFFVYDDSWRLVAAYKNTGSTPYSISSTASLMERYVPHAAGLDGRGGSSYIDSMAVRDLDITGDATLEGRGYFIQNWRADLVGVMRPDGVLPGWFKYSAYGKHQEVLLADVDDGNGTGVRDGGLTTDDLLYFLAKFELGTAEADITNDGGVTIDDLLLYEELFEAGGPATTSRVMYAGYQYDAKVELYHVRFRVYSTEIGSWLTQDPLGYVDGSSLYEYVGSLPLVYGDPTGLIKDWITDMLHGIKRVGRGAWNGACAIAGSPEATAEAAAIHDFNMLAIGFLDGLVSNTGSLFQSIASFTREVAGSVPSCVLTGIANEYGDAALIGLAKETGLTLAKSYITGNLLAIPTRSGLKKVPALSLTCWAYSNYGKLERAQERYEKLRSQHPELFDRLAKHDLSVVGALLPDVINGLAATANLGAGALMAKYCTSSEIEAFKAAQKGKCGP